MDNTAPVERIEDIEINEHMEENYLTYAMSVIVGRALPDVRDGLKPVQRRILYGMYEAGNTADKSYLKSAKTVGAVLGKYHPHGDASVYETMVRLAQDFVLRYPLVDGQGNFGSVDGDPAAAMRYTEARLSKLAAEMLRDIEKDTVDFGDNFDNSEKEPLLLPSRFPNLLVNGSTGIAVGMATNIPPHNLTEVIDGALLMMQKPETTNDELCFVVKGPDFPTGANILGTDGIKSAYKTGKGSVTMRATAAIEQMAGGKQRIVVTEIPYNVNKARLIEKIAELHRDKKVEGITDLRDESDRNGMSIVIEVRRDVNPNVLLNQLYKYSQLQHNFSIHMLALVNGRPQTLTLRQVLRHYIVHQIDVIVRRAKFEKRKAEARAHIVEGLLKALDTIDVVIETIRGAATTDVAKANLIERFGFTETQAQHILDMQLRRLTGLEREKLDEEYNELAERIEYLTALINSEDMQRGVLQDELLELKRRFGDERRTQITFAAGDINRADVEPDDEVVVTLSHSMYVKKVPIDTYRSQKRGGRGVQGAQIKKDDDNDFIEHMVTTTSHHWLLFLTNKGRVYKVQCWDIPTGSRQAKGTPIINVLTGLQPGEQIKAVIPVRDLNEENLFLFFATTSGTVKKTALNEYENIRQTGINAIKLTDGDSLLNVKMTAGESDVILISSKGNSIRFHESDVRPTGRDTQGVIGITLDEEFGDLVIGMDVVDPDASMMVVTSKGMGKRTLISEHRTQGRGGKGMKAIQLVPEKHGDLVGVQMVHDDDDLIVVSQQGVMIRIPVNSVRPTGRATQGVTVMNMDQKDSISTVARIVSKDDDGDGNEE